MSVGYAELLAPRADVGGTLGGPEVHDGARSLLDKMAQLAAMIRDAKAALESGTPLEMPAPPPPQPKRQKLPPKNGTTTAPPPTAQPPRPSWDPTRPHASPLVVFTGAGFSTSCGIPDFRGPNGVWTLRSKGKPVPASAVSFSLARPSLAHMALVKLHTAGYLSLVVSQNVDGLHLRSGLPRDALAELHGDCFAERCAECGGEFVRDFEMPSVGFKPTGRRCGHPPQSSSTAAVKKKASSLPVPAAFVANGNPPHTELLGAARPPHHHPHHHHHNGNHVPSCNGPLHDQCLDWDDPLPPKELREAERRASAAAVTLCLGTSLQIRPAGDLPLRTPRNGGALAIVNLQQTPKDKKAAVVCRARCDEAAAALLDALGLEAPVFQRHDRLLVSHSAAWETKKKSASSSSFWGVELSIGSVHGPDAPLSPLVKRVEVFFEEEEERGGGGGGKRQAAAASSFSFDLSSSSAERPPLVVRRSAFSFSSPSNSGNRPVTAVLRLTLVDEGHDGDDDGDRALELRHAIAPPPLPACSSAAMRGAATLTFETQRVDYGARQRELLEELRRRAAEEDRAPPLKEEEPPHQQVQRRPRAPAAQQQRYGERAAEAAAIFFKEEEEEEEEDEEDDDGSDTEFVPSRACRAAAATAATTTATGGSRGSSGSARASSSRPRKAAKLLDV